MKISCTDADLARIIKARLKEEADCLYQGSNEILRGLAIKEAKAALTELFLEIIEEDF